MNHNRMLCALFLSQSVVNISLAMKERNEKDNSMVHNLLINRFLLKYLSTFMENVHFAKIYRFITVAMYEISSNRV